uniref:PI31 proteasome regulator N-terminal domain-containing protein n=1 Tax=Gouania willdenowi TaxID=441366 RepID=A0A8C5GD91_GOUWI
MKLRVRVQGRISEVVLHGSDSRVSELFDAIRSSVLSSHGLRSDCTDSDFSLSLSGSERLLNSDQTLKDCGVVSGDLIYVGLPPAAHSSSSSSADTGACSVQVRPDKVGVLTPHTDPDPEEKPLSWEPMVCGEAEPGQVPPTLERLLLSTECCSSSDALMVAAHLMMLESGFSAQVSWSHVPPGWRSTAGVYRLNYVHSLCDRVVVTTAAVCLNSKLSINMILKVENTLICTHNLVLTPSTYVMDQGSGCAAAAFKDLRKLSRLFKDQLAYRMIAAARDGNSSPAHVFYESGRYLETAVSHRDDSFVSPRHRSYSRIDYFILDSKDPPPVPLLYKIF